MLAARLAWLFCQFFREGNKISILTYFLLTPYKTKGRRVEYENTIYSSVPPARHTMGLSFTPYYADAYMELLK